MVFIPSPNSPSKYCYSLPLVDNATNYLLRVMFPSSSLKPKSPHDANMSLAGHSARFNLSVDSTVISTIDLFRNLSQIVELVVYPVYPVDSLMFICLIPLQDSFSKNVAAVSSVELRPLSRQMYREGRGGSGTSKNGSSVVDIPKTFLLLVSRVNFGGDEAKPAIRFPLDPYDRLWYAAKSELKGHYELPLTTKSTNDNFTNNFPNFNYPPAVLQSAWEDTTVISYTLDVGTSRSIDSFYFSVFLYDVSPEAEDGKEEDIEISDGPQLMTWAQNSPIYSNMSWAWWNYRQTFIDDKIQIRVWSESNATINALELYGEFPADLQRGALVELRNSLENISSAFGVLANIDTNGDPCIPVPWEWVSNCSIREFADLDLSGRRMGELPAVFIPSDLSFPGSIKIMNLSNNGFYGSLPYNLTILASELILDDNNLSAFSLTALGPPNYSQSASLSLRNNRFTIASLLDLLNHVNASSRLLQLYLGGNNLNGSLPAEIANLLYVEELDLSNNQLSGSLPAEIAGLIFLDLSNIKLSGNVSDELPKFQQCFRDSKDTFFELHLENNMLMGDFPADWSWAAGLSSGTL
ncbi:hypothetical protein R1sor_025044 [Riccia sorocarpa]|uniref:Malectin-like domain-containing protein n=1 Tax=Riccia sorocarpa TaxID=122646 RepID=A0ABD3G8T5_9MARC